MARYPKPMDPIDLDGLRECLDEGPEYLLSRDIARLFGVQLYNLRRIPGLAVPLGIPKRGFHRSAVWKLAVDHQALVYAERQKKASAVDLTRHEWCDPRIIRAMLARWQDDTTTIQELHDRADVRPVKRVPRRYVPSAATDFDDEDDF